MTALEKPESSVGTERRTSPRVQVSLPVVLRGVDTLGRQFVEQTATMNISAGGAYFCTKRPLAQGQAVDVSMDASSATYESGKPSLPIWVEAKVEAIRVQEVANRLARLPRLFGVAVQFTDTPELAL